MAILTTFVADLILLPWKSFFLAAVTVFFAYEFAPYTSWVHDEVQNLQRERDIILNHYKCGPGDDAIENPDEVSERTGLTSSELTGNNCWAVIAGGSEGIGLAWAKKFLSYKNAFEGVLILGRSKGKLKSAKAELKEYLTKDILPKSKEIQKFDTKQADTLTKIETLSIDVGSLTSESFRSQISENPKLLKNKRIAFFVYNAASYGDRGAFVDVKLEDHLKPLDVNIKGLIVTLHEVANSIKKSELPGAFIAMSSMAGETGSSIIANYAASKAYITALLNGAHYELKKHNIDALACVAGATRTPSYLSVAESDENKENNASIFQPLYDFKARFIEQEPSEVVNECFAALNKGAPSLATGFINKFGRWVFKLLPVATGVRMFSDETAKVFGIELEELWGEDLKR